MSNNADSQGSAPLAEDELEIHNNRFLEFVRTREARLIDLDDEFAAIRARFAIEVRKDNKHAGTISALLQEATNKHELYMSGVNTLTNTIDSSLERIHTKSRGRTGQSLAMADARYDFVQEYAKTIGPATKYDSAIEAMKNVASRLELPNEAASTNQAIPADISNAPLNAPTGPKAVRRRSTNQTIPADISTAPSNAPTGPKAVHTRSSPISSPNVANGSDPSTSSQGYAINYGQYNTRVESWSPPGTFKGDPTYSTVRGKPIYHQRQYFDEYGNFIHEPSRFRVGYSGPSNIARHSSNNMRGATHGIDYDLRPLYRKRGRSPSVGARSSSVMQKNLISGDKDTRQAAASSTSISKNIAKGEGVEASKVAARHRSIGKPKMESLEQPERRFSRVTPEEELEVSTDKLKGQRSHNRYCS